MIKLSSQSISNEKYLPMSQENSQRKAVALSGIFFYITFLWCCVFVLYLRASIPGNDHILILFASLILLSCVTVPLIFSRYITMDSWLKQHVLFFSIVFIFFLPLVAFYTGLGVYWTWGVYIIVACCGLSQMAKLVLQLPRWYILPLFIGSLGTAVLFQALLNTQIFNILTSEAILLGAGYHDTLFHIAISSMIKNYGVPSLGLDGLDGIRYHYGAHTWFAAISKATGAQLIYVYPLIILTLLYPMLFFTLSALTIYCFRISQENIWACIFMPLLLTIPYHLFGYHTHRVVETYILSIIPLLWGFGMAVSPFTGNRNGKIDINFILYLVLFSLIAFLVCMVKVSSGFILAVSAVFLWWLSFGFGKRWFLAITILFTSIVVAFVSFTFSNHGIFASSNEKLRWMQCIYFAFEILLKHLDWWSYISYPVAALFLWGWAFLNQRGIKNVSQAKELQPFYNYGLVIIVISCLGAAAGLLTLRQDWIYFAQPALWLSIPLLVGLLFHVLQGKLFKDVPIIVGPASIGLFCSGIWLAGILPNNNIGIKNSHIAMIHQMNREEKLYNDSSKMGLSWVVNTQDILDIYLNRFDETDYGKMYRILTKNTGIRTLVFVEPNNTFFWTHNINYEFASTLYVPAVIGVPMIKGLPPLELEETFLRRKRWWYGDESRSVHVSDDLLFQYARNKKFQTVFRFAGLQENLNRKISLID